MSLRDAYQFVKKKRPIIRPNPRFWQSLIDYERKMFGKTTVTMKESDVGENGVLIYFCVSKLKDISGGDRGEHRWNSGESARLSPLWFQV